MFMRLLQEHRPRYFALIVLGRSDIISGADLRNCIDIRHPPKRVPNSPDRKVSVNRISPTGYAISKCLQCKMYLRFS